MENKPLVLIGMPNGSGHVPAVMVTSLLQLKKPCPCAFMIIERQMIEAARNAICSEAMRVNATHVLFVDDDNPIPQDTLECLLADDKDVVIAPILSRNPNSKGVHDLCAFYSEEVEGVKIYRNIEQFKDDGYLHRVDGGGTGCMLIKTEVLRKLSVKYPNRMFERTRDVFASKITVDGKDYTERTMSEDVQFCERAIEDGFEVWLDSRVKPLHIISNKFIQYGKL